MKWLEEARVAEIYFEWARTCNLANLVLNLQQCMQILATSLLPEIYEEKNEMLATIPGSNNLISCPTRSVMEFSNIIGLSQIMHPNKCKSSFSLDACFR